MGEVLSPYLPQPNTVLTPEMNGGNHICEKFVVEVYGEGPQLVMMVDDGITRANGGLSKIKEMFLDPIQNVSGVKFVVIRPFEPILSTSLQSGTIRRRIDNCVATCKRIVSMLQKAAEQAELELTPFDRTLLDVIGTSELTAIIADGLTHSMITYGHLNVKNGFNEILEYLKELGLDGLLYRYSASQVPANGIPEERQIRKEPGELARLLTELAGRFVPQTA